MFIAISCRKKINTPLYCCKVSSYAETLAWEKWGSETKNIGCKAWYMETHSGGITGRSVANRGA